MERTTVPAAELLVPPGKVGIVNLQPAQCRFVCDDGYFCAEPTGDVTKVYCQHHHDICWINPKKKGKVSWRNFRPRASQLSA